MQFQCNCVAVLLLQTILATWAAFGASSSTAPSRPKQTTSSVNHSSDLSSKCQQQGIAVCRKYLPYTQVTYPNLLGHRNLKEATQDLLRYRKVLTLKDNPKCKDSLAKFLCPIYSPQCTVLEGAVLPPCQAKALCLRAKKNCAGAFSKRNLTWSEEWDCETLPDEGLCTDMDANVTPVPAPFTRPPKPAVLEKIKRNSTSHNKQKPSHHPVSVRHDIKPRRYDVEDKGDPKLFRGWADVQGQGAANDFCRIVGSNPKKRFLACSLAGSTGQGHIFVSQRGFDVGHWDTWFMRDMDGDGKDDYCRCVGSGIKSRMSCMKSGVNSFHGSIKEKGSQYSFDIQNSSPCISKKLDPALGL